MIKTGIISGAGYIAGELIRLLLDHPETEIVFINSSSNAGNRITDVHEDLYGETDLTFADQLPLDEIGVLFFCTAHRDTKKLIESHNIPENLKIIDLSMDYRIKSDNHDFIYGLPELNRRATCTAKYVANLGCFATCIQLSLLPLVKSPVLADDVMVNAITGSTGARAEPGATSHLSWRNNNMSVCKAFEHQHVPEIKQSLRQLQNSFDAEIDFIPYHGDLARDIFTTLVVKTKVALEETARMYEEYYAKGSSVYIVDESIDLKQVANTNECLIHLEKHGDKLLIIPCIDNLLKGANGQAVHNMNLMFNLEEIIGLRLKPSAFQKQRIMELFDAHPLYSVNIVKDDGCEVWDESGTEYLDLYGGHAVISIRHAHPHYTATISNQVAKLDFYSNSVINKLQQEVAERLGKISGYEDYSLFLINSGAEANENALKLASFYNGRVKIVSFNEAFHGRTSLAVEAIHNPSIIAPISNNGHVTYLPLNDVGAMRQELSKGNTCAVIIEGIQDVGGIKMPATEFMQELCKACSETGTILILDEIQNGYGRGGKFFAHQYNDIKPDIITIAKGIGNGLLVAGVLISPMFEPVYGQLGATSEGNHLVCSTTLAVMDVIEQENPVENARAVDDYLLEELKKFPQIEEVRGCGLTIGLKFEEPIKELRSHLIYDEHVFTGTSGTNALCLLPPLCLSMEEARKFPIRFKKVF